MTEITFFTVVSSISILIGLIMGGLTISKIHKSRLKQRVLSEKLEKEKFKEILKSSDIDQIGDYLNNEVGKMYISDYLDNKDLNFKLDRLVNKLTNFLDPNVGFKSTVESEDSKGDESTESRNHDNYYETAYKELIFSAKISNSQILNSIVKDFQYGNSWNSMARLRNEIELSLRNYGLKLGIKNKRIPIRHLIEIMKENKYLENRTIAFIRDSLDISNRIVHGNELSFEEVSRGMQKGILALHYLNNTLPNIG